MWQNVGKHQTAVMDDGWLKGITESLYIWGIDSSKQIEITGIMLRTCVNTDLSSCLFTVFTFLTLTSSLYFFLLSPLQCRLLEVPISSSQFESFSATSAPCPLQYILTPSTPIQLYNESSVVAQSQNVHLVLSRLHVQKVEQFIISEPHPL